jgi:uncharacterized membrane protein YjjP (DUF1212 family)
MPPSPPDPSTSESTPAELAFIELARALHRYGTGAFMLEQTLGRVAARLGLEAQVFSTPTAVFLATGPTARQRVRLLRLEPGAYDLGRLAELDAVLTDLLGGQIDADGALARVRAVEQAPPRWSPLAGILAYCVACAAGGRTFGGGWREMVLGAVVGLMVGGLAVWFDRAARLRSLLLPVGAGVAAACASVGAWLLAPASAPTVVLAGVLPLLPGLTLTVSMMEVATGHLASGSARLIGAISAFIQLGFGAALGLQVERLLPGSAALGPTPDLPAWVDVLAITALPLAFTVSLQARREDVLAMVSAGVLAFLGARAGTATFGPELGAFAGALLVGVAANTYARAAKRPASIPLVAGILMLVPGSLGFRSIVSMMADDTLRAVDTAFSVALVAVGIGAGLLVANALLPPRRPL